MGQLPARSQIPGSFHPVPSLATGTLDLEVGTGSELRLGVEGGAEERGLSIKVHRGWVPLYLAGWCSPCPQKHSGCLHASRNVELTIYLHLAHSSLAGICLTLKPVPANWPSGGAWSPPAMVAVVAMLPSLDSASVIPAPSNKVGSSCSHLSPQRRHGVMQGVRVVATKLVRGGWPKPG